ncbi:SIMPL domain-containing protein [Chelativorans sp. AA-79]|uniref:SIMPL domain-containing protein n=1 Tax=Chelativorans sp. AA-79 TaxID=3028735 RepID=UPI0023F83ECF|nr:SIMPL domain-containing protein [Chelativorans sp. AA-79]WEX11280.1 SIMPL domain-containing protein [Chelativorans sp. AA-79]
MTRSFIPLALAASFLAALPAGAQESDRQPKISVTGEGEATLAPDMAIIRLSVVREAETAREAMDANSQAMVAVVAALKEAGIEERDLQTTGLSIDPRYVYPNDQNDEKEPRITGYQVTNGLTVRIRDLDKVGEILDRSVTLGVNQGGNIFFTNDDPSSAMNDARKKAVEDAVSKARILAETAGVKLGDVIEISEHMIGTPPPRPLGAKMMRMEAAADASVPVQAGENSYTVQVNVTFGLDQQ